MEKTFTVTDGERPGRMLGGRWCLLFSKKSAVSSREGFVAGKGQSKKETMYFRSQTGVVWGAQRMISEGCSTIGGS